MRKAKNENGCILVRNIYSTLVLIKLDIYIEHRGRGQNEGNADLTSKQASTASFVCASKNFIYVFVCVL